jgi:EmrB/QacA subfamily drug resistance transporter
MTATRVQERTFAAAGREGAVPWLAVSIVLAAMFMGTLDSFIVIVAGPAIQADLHTSGGELQWILAGYQLTFAVFLITGGRLGDRLGRRRVFLSGSALFVFSSIACALAPTAATLIVARLVQGLGAALMIPQIFAFVVVLVDEGARHRVFGVLGIALGLAAIGGQLIGGALIAADVLGSGWRAVFWVNVPIGLIVLVLGARHLPRPPADVRSRLDVPGVLVLSIVLFLISFPLIQGRQAGWPWWSWATLAAGVVGLGAFAQLEQATALRGRDPLVRVSLFRARSFSIGLCLVLSIYAVISSYYLMLSVALQQGLGLSALDAGLVFAPAGAAFLGCSVLAGRLVPRHGRRVLELGGLLLSLGYAATATLLFAGAPFTAAVVIPTLVLQSVGGGLIITPSLNTVLSRIELRDAGTASGVLSTAQQIGAAMGVALIGIVFYDTLGPTTHDSAYTAGHALASASIFALICSMIATTLVFALPKA